MSRIGMLTMLLLALGGCGSSASSTGRSGEDRQGEPLVVSVSRGVTAESLGAYVGKRVIVRGVWRGPGKVSDYIAAIGHDGEPVYVRATRGDDLPTQGTLNAIPYGTTVEAVGVLRFYESPLPEIRGDVPVSRPQSHFYLDVSEAIVNVVNRNLETDGCSR